MTKIDWKRKLSSRKLWAAVAGIVTGLAMVFGLDEGTISSVAGAVVSVASVVAYIVTEGKVDAQSVKTTAEATDTTAPATELIVFSSRPNTIARPVTIPATAAHSLRELSLCFQSILFMLHPSPAIRYVSSSCAA